MGHRGPVNLNELLQHADPAVIAAAGLEAAFLTELENGEAWLSAAHLAVIASSLPSTWVPAWDDLRARAARVISDVATRAVLNDVDACLRLGTDEDLALLVKMQFHPSKHLLRGLCDIAEMPYADVLANCYSAAPFDGESFPDTSAVLSVLRLRQPEPLSHTDELLAGVDPLWSIRFLQLRRHLETDEGNYPNARTVMGRWLVKQRFLQRRELLGPIEFELLETLPHWVWDPPLNPYGELFLDRMRWFTTTAAATGTSLTMLDETMPSSDTPVRQWLSDLRRRYETGWVCPSVCSEFEALPDWSWDHEWWETETVLRLLELMTEGGAVLDERLLSVPAQRVLRRFRRSGESISEPVRDRLERVPGWRWLNGKEEEHLRERYELALRLQVVDLPPALSLVVVRRTLAEHPEHLRMIGGSIGRSREAVRRDELRLADFLEHPNARLAYELEGGNARLPGPGSLRLERIKEMRMVLNETIERFSVVDSPKNVNRGCPQQDTTPSPMVDRADCGESIPTGCERQSPSAGPAAMLMLPPRVRRVLDTLGLTTTEQFLGLEAYSLLRERGVGFGAVEAVMTAQNALRKGSGGGPT
jgi:hypothetical protein